MVQSRALLGLSGPPRWRSSAQPSTEPPSSSRRAMRERILPNPVLSTRARLVAAIDGNEPAPAERQIP